MTKLLIAGIRLYQRLLSPMLGQNCRFHPSCSQYAIDALRLHGIFVGTGYALWRVMRCQPFCSGGHDPVPESKGLMDRPSRHTQAHNDVTTGIPKGSTK